jgi:hypothetical protein
MEADDLVRHYPRLFHMAEAGSWPSIERNGLLSTSALLDLFGVNGPERNRLESRKRPESVTIEHSEYGVAVIRDQKPLREGPLEKCLTGMTLEEWYRTLNTRVFFWLREERLVGLLSARPYRNRAHDVVTVDTRMLIERCGSRITLSPINSGSTIYNPRPRGTGTFVAIADYPFDRMRRSRRIADAVVELAVERGVENVEQVALAVDSRQADRVIANIWRKPT